MPEENNILGGGPSSTSTPITRPLVPPQENPVQQPRPTGPKPNVRLAASQEEHALPEGLCNIGMGSVMIPSKEAQLAGFYVDDPGLLVGQFRQYKFTQEKGQAHDQHIKL